MEFSLFVWGVCGFFFMLSGLWSLLLQRIDTTKIVYTYLTGLGLLVLISLIFTPYSMQIFLNFNKSLDPYIRNLTNSHLMIEVWHSVVFFRNVWSALILAILAIGLEASSHPYSNRHRMMKDFNHNKLLIMVGVLIVYFLVQPLKLGEPLNVLLLNIALYTAVYYWRFGFSTILYIFKKYYVPYSVGILLQIVPIILVGEYFLLVLVATVGIGMSDIWMDYHKRNAASMVFSLDFSN